MKDDKKNKGLRGTKGKFIVKAKIVDRIPSRIGRGMDGDPIYDPMTTKAYRSCLDYYEQAERFLEGKSKRCPKIESVLKAAVPHGSVLEARLDDLGTLDAHGIKLLVKFEDADRPSERTDRSPRWFDPEYFPALLLLTYAGGSFRFNDRMSKSDASGAPTQKDARRFFLSFGRGKDQNIRVLRIIMDAPAGCQVHRKTSNDRDFHYDHRRSVLHLKLDDAERENGHPSGFSMKGRAEAFKIAAAHMEAALVSRKTSAKVADPSLSGAELIKLLERVFHLADRLNTRLHLDKSAQNGTPEE